MELRLGVEDGAHTAKMGQQAERWREAGTPVAISSDRHELKAVHREARGRALHHLLEPT